ncbi:MAG: hypothetical protein AAB758_00095 [Patescibacteria group bacterium]
METLRRGGLELVIRPAPQQFRNSRIDGACTDESTVFPDRLAFVPRILDPVRLLHEVAGTGSVATMTKRGCTETALNETAMS